MQTLKDVAGYFKQKKIPTRASDTDEIGAVPIKDRSNEIQGMIDTRNAPNLVWEQSPTRILEVNRLPFILMEYAESFTDQNPRDIDVLAITLSGFGSLGFEMFRVRRNDFYGLTAHPRLVQSDGPIFLFREEMGRLTTVSAEIMRKILENSSVYTAKMTRERSAAILQIPDTQSPPKFYYIPTHMPAVVAQSGIIPRERFKSLAVSSPPRKRNMFRALEEGLARYRKTNPAVVQVRSTQPLNPFAEDDSDEEVALPGEPVAAETVWNGVRVQTTVPADLFYSIQWMYESEEGDFLLKRGNRVEKISGHTFYTLGPVLKKSGLFMHSVNVYIKKSLRPDGFNDGTFFVKPDRIVPRGSGSGRDAYVANLVKDPLPMSLSWAPI